ncbi:sperm-associated antigen 8-like [Liolophura sinensis]|uniref:sperm-associated antigen 8-like n=1 Tax=Liolophura sinensis TaxID=3198878 RepID=UPI0031595624
MSLLNQGRNEIRFNNSGGKCLLENWVEERAVYELDPQELSGNITSKAQLLKDGHAGILNRDFSAKVEGESTVMSSYKVPQKVNVRLTGKKQEMIERMVLEKVHKEIQDINPQVEPPDYKSVTMKDFNIEDFVSQKPKPTHNHDYKRDQAVTFWTEHADKITGVSQKKTGDSAFRKNDAFSKPIDERWDEPLPYELENYPKM